MARWTIETVRDKLKIICSDIILPNDDFINVKTKMLFRCVVCGKEWMMTWDGFSKIKRCTNCVRYSRISIEQIIHKMKSINPNISISENVEYRHNKQKLECTCSVCGRIWGASWANLQKGKGCPSCLFKKLADAKRLNIQDIKERLTVINPNITITSTSYTTSNSKLKCECKICNNIWKVSWNALQSNSGCPVCAIKMRSGENHSNYNPDLTDEERLTNRDLRENVKWRNKIYERDDYTCVKCNTRGHKLNAHHLNGYHWCEDERFDLENGASLCENCHKEFHLIYGYKHNTKEQFEEFIMTDIA